MTTVDYTLRLPEFRSVGDEIQYKLHGQSRKKAPPQQNGGPPSNMT